MTTAKHTREGTPEREAEWMAAHARVTHYEPEHRHVLCPRAAKDKSLLELGGIGRKSTAWQYVHAIKRYINSAADDEGSYKSLVAVMGAKIVLTASQMPRATVAILSNPNVMVLE